VCFLNPAFQLIEVVSLVLVNLDVSLTSIFLYISIFCEVFVFFSFVRSSDFAGTPASASLPLPLGVGIAFKQHRFYDPLWAGAWCHTKSEWREWRLSLVFFLFFLECS